MILYVNRSPVEGPWGGGSKVLDSIVNLMRQRGHQVILEQSVSSVVDVDLIFCFDPRNSSVSYEDLLWLRHKHGVPLVQRVGDLGTHGKPDLFNRVIETTTLSDFVIFPSEWSRNQLSLPTEKTVVITNAPSQKFFVTGQKKDYRGTLEIVTHHWSDNVMKGFEVYREVDKFCQSSAGDFRFTYVGRKPASFSPVNLVPPQDITGIVYNLSKAHVYLTASQQEAGANHVLEAMAMKLPVLYHSGGGSIVEYCAGRGFSYDSVDQLFDILKNRKKDIEITQENMDYSRTGDHMAEEYVKLFESMS